MKWNKRGLIFDPRNYNLSNNCKEFAQSPQVLVFDEFVRIYFSTRTKDKDGQYLSYISYVDMDLDLTIILNLSKRTVLELGGLGTFDEHGVFPISPLRIKDRILAYTTGWSRRVSVPVETGIGVVESFDNGETFHRLSNGPILSSSLHEPFLVGDALVKNYNNMFYMFYIFGTKWMNKSMDEPETRVYKIGLAKSEDGLNWTKNEAKKIISDVLNENECQALPTVIKVGNLYHMYFCYRESTNFRKNKERGYKLGYAYSYDLENWVRDDSKSGFGSSENQWDSDMKCYPHLFEANKKIFILYNGNEFGRFGFGAAELIEF
jgi:hypothetical protein